jgi:hypothetical protein
MSGVSSWTRRDPGVGSTATLGIALLLAVVLTGCGKKNLPAPPPGQPVTYPAIYPRV